METFWIFLGQLLYRDIRVPANCDIMWYTFHTVSVHLFCLWWTQDSVTGPFWIHHLSIAMCTSVRVLEIAPLDFDPSISPQSTSIVRIKIMRCHRRNTYQNLTTTNWMGHWMGYWTGPSFRTLSICRRSRGSSHRSFGLHKSFTALLKGDQCHSISNVQSLV